MKNPLISEMADLSHSPLLAIDQLGRQLGPSLIIAPHPDDEALGCGGIISYLRSQHVPVTIVFMTSGGASHPNSLSFPAPELAKLREQEAITSCQILGVNEEDVLFYRYPDGELSDFDDHKITEISQQLAELIDTRNIKTIFYPWRRDIHPDHVMTSSIAFSAIQHCHGDIQIVEYPVWLWNIAQQKDWPSKDEVSVFRLDVKPVLNLKRDAICAHRSQTTNLIDDDPQGFCLTDDLLAPFLKDYEIYFFTKDQNLKSLDQEFFDTLYSENLDPWNFKHSEYELAKYQKTDDLLRNMNFDNGLEIGCSIGIQSQFFAERCQRLLSVDISKDAIAEAENTNRDLKNVTFQLRDIVKDFPEEQFDFISLCELGYYFVPDTLRSIFQNVGEHLVKDGIFLMVHWTSFVREFPLNGNQVNQIFKEYNAVENLFACDTTFIHDNYELHILRKI